jgi:uncharacterized membrane protein
MTRDEFMRRLRRGLAPMGEAEASDIAADYEAHFDAALEDGRSEAEVAEALGDPGRLARELKLEAGIRRWEEGRSPSAAWSAVIAFLILAPVLLPALGVMLGLYVAMLGLFVAGGAIMIVGPFSLFPGGPLAALLSGAGMMSAAVAFTALLLIVSIWLVNALMWFGRLHYRILQPAIESTEKRSTAP